MFGARREKDGLRLSDSTKSAAVELLMSTIQMSRDCHIEIVDVDVDDVFVSFRFVLQMDFGV